MEDLPRMMNLYSSGPMFKLRHRASIGPIHFDDFFLAHRRMVKYRERILFVNDPDFALNHDLVRIVKFIGIRILNPLTTSNGLFSQWHWGASMFGLQRYFWAWVLIDTIMHPCFKHCGAVMEQGSCAFGE